MKQIRRTRTHVPGTRHQPANGEAKWRTAPWLFASGPPRKLRQLHRGRFDVQAVSRTSVEMRLIHPNAPLFHLQEHPTSAWRLTDFLRKSDMPSLLDFLSNHDLVILEPIYDCSFNLQFCNIAAIRSRVVIIRYTTL